MFKPNIKILVNVIFVKPFLFSVYRTIFMLRLLGACQMYSVRAFYRQICDNVFKTNVYISSEVLLNTFYFEFEIEYESLAIKIVIR